jgi:hypothetical protein
VVCLRAGKQQNKRPYAVVHGWPTARRLRC